MSKHLKKTVVTNSKMNKNSSENNLLQHKADIAYSKYLQSLQLKKILRLKNQETEQIVNAQLTIQTESLQEKIEETETMKSQIELTKKYSELYTTLQTLSKISTDFNSMDMKEIKDFSRNIQFVSDKLHCEGFNISKDETAKLSEVIEKLSTISSEVTCDYNENFLKFIEKCSEIREIARKMNILQKSIENEQKKVNSLVLKASSLKLR